jgi:hypothetical protein
MAKTPASTVATTHDDRDNRGVTIDLRGRVECRVSSRSASVAIWQVAADLAALRIPRDYDAFGCLFGVTNYAHFRPVAADRGLPADASDDVVAAHAGSGRSAFGATWVGWLEIEAIDWDEPAEHPDSRIHRFTDGPDGTLAFAGKSSWNSDLARLLGVTIAEGVSGDRTWPEGSEWRMGHSVYRSVRLRRRDAVPSDGGWQATWEIMRILAGLHGDDAVRLVVWFDR